MNNAQTRANAGSQAIPAEDIADNVIEARRGWQLINVKELWQFCELAYFLCRRDIKIRYKQTALGALWAIFQPLLNVVVFAIFFGRLGRMGQGRAGCPNRELISAESGDGNLSQHNVERRRHVGESY